MSGYTKLFGRGVLITDPEIRRRAGEFGRSPMVPRRKGLRGIRAIHPDSWTDDEIAGLVGFADLEATTYASDALDGLVAIPEWLMRMHGLTHASKLLYVLIAFRPDETIDQLVARFGDEWQPEWCGWVVELQRAGLVVRVGEALRAVRRAL